MQQNFAMQRYLVLKGQAIDTELRVSGLSSNSKEPSVSIVIYDSAGQACNELIVHPRAGEVSRVNLGDLLIGCDFEEGLRVGNAAVTIAPGLLCECALLQGRRVFLQRRLPSDENRFFNVRIGEGRGDSLWLLSADRGDTALPLTMYSDDKEVEPLRRTEVLPGNGVIRLQVSKLLGELRVRHFVHVKIIRPLLPSCFKALCLESVTLDEGAVETSLTEL